MRVVQSVYHGDLTLIMSLTGGCRTFQLELTFFVISNYSDPVFHNSKKLNEQFGVKSNMSIFSTELSLELSDLKVAKVL